MTKLSIPTIRKFSVYALLILSGAVVGCTWVKPTPEAEKVRIVPADRVADCQQVGDLSTHTKAEVAGITRKATKVQQELETLARIEAVDLGADTIVATTQAKYGRQSFLAYRCK